MWRNAVITTGQPKTALTEIFETLQKQSFSVDNGVVRKVREQAEGVIEETAARFGLQQFPFPPGPAPKKGWKKANRAKAWKKAFNDHDSGVWMLPDGFVREPFGTQASPDFVFIFGKQLIFIDIKSSKDGRPTLNDNLPARNTIYVFASSKLSRFTFAQGSDLVSEAMRGLQAEYWNELRRVGASMNAKRPSGESAEFGWRKCFTFNSNPFSDKILGLDRVTREDRVLQRLVTIGSNLTTVS